MWKLREKPPQKKNFGKIRAVPVKGRRKPISLKILKQIAEVNPLHNLKKRHQLRKK